MFAIENSAVLGNFQNTMPAVPGVMARCRKRSALGFVKCRIQRAQCAHGFLFHVQPLQSKALGNVGNEILRIGHNAARTERPAVDKAVHGEFVNVHAIEMHLANGSVF